MKALSVVISLPLLTLHVFGFSTLDSYLMASWQAGAASSLPILPLQSGRLNDTLDSIPSSSTAAKVNIVGTGSLKPLKKECHRDSNIKCLPLVVEYR